MGRRPAPPCPAPQWGWCKGPSSQLWEHRGQLVSLHREGGIRGPGPAQGGATQDAGSLGPRATGPGQGRPLGHWPGPRRAWHTATTRGPCWRALNWRVRRLRLRDPGGVKSGVQGRPSRQLARRLWRPQPRPRPAAPGVPASRAGVPELRGLCRVPELPGPLLRLVCRRGAVSTGVWGPPPTLGPWGGTATPSGQPVPGLKLSPAPADAPGGPSAHGPRRAATGCGAVRSPVWLSRGPSRRT